MSEVISTVQDHAALVQSLARSLNADRTIETHISTVLLAGAQALKLKKPVAPGFLDFTTLRAREHFCREELRLNRRTAATLYLDVLPVIGALDAARLGVATDAPHAIDWALQMRRFDPEQGFDRRAARGEISAHDADALAQAVATLHLQADCAPLESAFGTPATVRRCIEANVAALRDGTGAAGDRARLDALAAWCAAAIAQHASLIGRRRLHGWVREGHGDLHLANIVSVDGVPQLFDALEFDPALRWIDVIDDVAFLFMDLCERASAPLAWRLLSSYLEFTGDWGGTALLPLYAVHRALVRARVAELRAQQPAVAAAERLRAHAGGMHYVVLAQALAQPPALQLVVMSGLSGSGKSVVAAELAAHLHALRVRSDVERKRLAGLPATTRGDASLYTAAMTASTYARLAEIAGTLLDAGVSVVVDSAALKADERVALLQVARARQCPATIVRCEAPWPLLQQRVAARALARADPSDATVDVLAQQRGWQQPRGAGEPPHVVIDTGAALAQVVAACRSLAHRMRGSDAGDERPQ